MSRVFLTAEWRHLVMLNYEIEPSVLEPLVPRGTALDRFDGRVYVSIVGFLFLNTRVFGVPIPFHRNFEEVNLRFYVGRESEEGWRRGVVFVSELVPRAAIAAVARLAYGEKYRALPMSHEFEFEPSDSRESKDLRSAAYTWRLEGQEHALRFRAAGPPEQIPDGGLEEFITEHYYGYAARKGGGTTEYRVAHPRWRVARASEVSFDADVAALYGEVFVPALSEPPASAFLADGSPVEVYTGARLGPA